MAESEQERRRISRERAAELDRIAHRFMEARRRIPTGFGQAATIARTRQRILEVLGGTARDWDDWRWQLRHRVEDAETLGRILDLDADDRRDIEEVGRRFRWGVSPHYLSLVDPEDRACPIWRQMIPSVEELALTGEPDFSGEEYTSPVRAVVRWYPDRVQFNVTNICSAFCRHCLRRRKIGDVDEPAPVADIEEGLAYIRAHPEIRDVLYTGGDPLTFGDDKLDGLLDELDAIEHVQIKRLGSRMPLTVPQRITPELCEMLASHHPLYLNTQFNHPKEVTPEAADAVDRLTRAGIPVGNQAVLLRGVNDDPDVMKLLNQELLRIRVRPYYLYHCQGTIGIAHHRTPVETGIEILEQLRGYTSGMAVPQYIVTPAGLGKTPLAPMYRISSGTDFVTLRNWEGRPYHYDNPRCVHEDGDR